MGAPCLHQALIVEPTAVDGQQQQGRRQATGGQDDCTLANWITKMPTPPAPACTSTREPALTVPCSKPCRQVQLLADSLSILHLATNTAAAEPAKQSAAACRQQEAPKLQAKQLLPAERRSRETCLCPSLHCCRHWQAHLPCRERHQRNATGLSQGHVLGCMCHMCHRYADHLLQTQQAKHGVW